MEFVILMNVLNILNLIVDLKLKISVCGVVLKEDIVFLMIFPKKVAKHMVLIKLDAEMMIIVIGMLLLIWC
jgi:hypothetical protein